MGAIGGLSPLALELGGDVSDMEIVYLTLRSAVGGDSGAGPVEGVEDFWRICKAEAIWAGMESMERAAMQALPRFATDHLEVYEDLLLVARESTDAERAIAVTLAFCLQLSADVPNLNRDLKEIDSRFAIQSIDYDKATLVQFGKAFGPRDGSVPYGSGLYASRTASSYPNFAHDFVLRVVWEASASAPTPNAEVLAQAKRLLNSALPSHVDFSITTYSAADGVGFFLDGGSDGTSLLDYTAFD